MGNKRIAFVLSNLAQGGSERQMVSLSIALASRGYDVDVLTYYGADFYNLSQYQDSVRYITFDCRNKLERIRKIRMYYRENRPNVIISLVDRAAVYALLAAAGMDLKFILTWRNSNCGIFSSLTGKIIDWSDRKIKSIVCNSENGKELWIRNRPKQKSKVAVIYNLINELSIGRKSKSILLHNRVIAIAARVVPDKNADGLIEAVAKLDDEKKAKLKVKWYGNPDDTREYYEKVISLRDSYHLDDVIEFANAVSNISEIMMDSDAVGLFSHREGFPNAVCEGMQIGKPILMTPVSDYMRLIDGNGFLCRSDNPADIAEAIERFVDCSDEELACMGKRSFDIFESNLNNESNIQKWITEITR